MNGEGAEREGDTESEAGSGLWAISPEPDAGLELTDREIMTWAEVGRLTDWATQVPREISVLSTNQKFPLLLDLIDYNIWSNNSHLMPTVAVPKLCA